MQHEKFHKILALDLGVGSIGWALISVPENIQRKEVTDIFTTTEPLVDGAEIIGMGTRVIPLDSADEKQKFETGKAVETNQKRTAKRQARRGYYRYKMRRISLKDALASKNMLDESLLSTQVLSKTKLWELRSKAATEQVSLTELGRIILHLNQKRGYNQNIKGQTDEKENKKEKKEKETEDTTTSETQKTTKKEGYTDKIKRNSKELGDKTIGQYVYEKLQENPYYRTKDIIYYRTDYENEFYKILNTQKIFYPEVLTQDFIDKLHHIIYYQRPLKSQKALVKICPHTERYIVQKIEKDNTQTEKIIKIGSRVAPKSSPLAEYKKILEAVNNVEIKVYVEQEDLFSTDGQQTEKSKKFRKKLVQTRKLYEQERDNLINALQNAEKLTKTEILKHLNLSPSRSAKEEYKINVDKIEGNKTRTLLANILGREHPLLQFDLKLQKRTFVNTETGEIHEVDEISPDVEKEPLYQLWHVIYSIKDIQECKYALIKRFNLDAETAEKLAKIEFTKGNNDFTNLSTKVMRHIIPYLEQGHQYSEAMEMAGYKHSKESRTKEENQKRVLKDSLALIPRNALRQPVVEKILNQMIHLVNEIIAPERGWVSKEERENGTFKIHIELARELKAGPQERKKIHELNNKRAKDNEKIKEYLKSKGIPAPGSRNNIIRYRLFRGVNVELKNEKCFATCLYSGKNIEFNQVFDDKYIDKDHIIPQSIYPDDSQGNLVLVYRDENKTKSNQTAYDYMFSKGMSEFEQYIARVQDAFNNGAITGVQVRNLLTTLEYDPNSHPHNTVEIKGKGKNGEYSIRVTKLDEEKGFAARDLRETSYITREARRILQDVCREVLTSTGSVTAELRHLWGYDDIIPQWHIQRLRELHLDNLIETKTIRSENNQETQKDTIKGWSKRDDHRHHALDALVVACTNRSIIQRINTAHAQETQEELKKQLPEQEAKKAQANTRMNILRKWLAKQCIFSPNEVKEKVDNILISLKPGKKVATWNKNKDKHGKWSVLLKRTLTPRGALHEETYYGKITQYKPATKNIKKLADDLDKLHLLAHKDKKTLFNDEKIQYYFSTKDTKNLLKYLKDTKKITQYTIYEPQTYFVARYGVSDISKKHTDKPEDFPDKKMYEMIKNAFPADAKEKDKIKGTVVNTVKDRKTQKTYTLNVRAIRMYTVKEDDEKETYYPVRFNEKGEPITFVRPGNNHHIAIYKNEKGELTEHICTFWHAVERKKYGVPVVIKNPKEVYAQLAEKENIPETFIKRLPNPDWQYVLSMQQNEMFVLNLSKDEIQEALQSKKYRKISRDLYKVRTVSPKAYIFIHQFCTTVDENNKYVKEQTKKIKSMGALEKANPIKVRINRLGEITEILEYLPEQSNE